MSIALPQIPLAESIEPLPSVAVDALYVHVPFCFHKCHYCDFYSITRQSPERMAAFVDRVLREADQWSTRFTATPIVPNTIFFGGGTPSLLPIDNMRDLIAGLRKRIDFSSVREFTVEANPATVSLGYAAMLRESGVDRLSFGAQSFDRAELKVLEREHDPADVSRSVELARSAGFDRLNVDLIFAIPGQSLDSWMNSLESAIALGTSHLSCYNLTYEPNTPMAVRQRLGEFVGTEETLELEMLRATRARLADAGYEAYEISNFARSGQACQHNVNYWTGGNYVGLGPSAASHVEGVRWKNRPHLGEWERAIDASELPLTQVERLTATKRAGELSMLTLRLARGLNFADYARRTGHDARQQFSDVISRYTHAGLLETDATAVRLTDRGIAVADALAAEFLSAASR